MAVDRDEDGTGLASPESAPAGLELRWMRTVRALRDPEMRICYLRSELEQAGLAAAAEALEVVAAGVEQADPLARQVLAAATPTLTDPAWSPRLDAIRAEATRRNHLALARLLRQRVPAAPGVAEAHEVPVAVSPSGRPLTLGERKSLARRPDRFTLDRLLRDPDPSVIRNLLRNPRITEDDVVRLAARRPNFAVVLEEVARHPKWSTSLRVRMALIQNPHAPTSLSVPLVPLLLRHELVQVALATTLPMVVRAAALEQLDRRPPIRAETSDTTH